MYNYFDIFLMSDINADTSSIHLAYCVSSQKPQKGPYVPVGRHSKMNEGMIIIVIIISGCTVLVRTFAALHRRFRNLVKTHFRTPLNEWSARSKGLYLHRTTYKHKLQTSMPSAGFEPAIPATKGPHGHCVRHEAMIVPVKEEYNRVIVTTGTTRSCMNCVVKLTL
jgi:hypothetical protein